MRISTFFIPSIYMIFLSTFFEQSPESKQALNHLNIYLFIVFEIAVLW